MYEVRFTRYDLNRSTELTTKSQIVNRTSYFVLLFIPCSMPVAGDKPHKR